MAENFPAARLGPNNGNRYIALGENDAYYIHYHDENIRCWTGKVSRGQNMTQADSVFRTQRDLPNRVRRG